MNTKLVVCQEGAQKQIMSCEYTIHRTANKQTWLLLSVPNSESTLSYHVYPMCSI